MTRHLPLIALGLLIGLSLGSGARAADDVSLLLNWYLGGLHTPFYLGKERGYYEDEGINLTINAARAGRFRWSPPKVILSGCLMQAA